MYLKNFFPSLADKRWMKITKEWTHDTDFDDLFQNSQDEKIELNYSIVTNILLTLFVYNDKFKREIYNNFEIQKYTIEGMKADFEENDLLNLQINNIRELFTALTRYPVSTMVPRLCKSGDIIVYRGFRKTYNLFFDKLQSMNRLEIGKYVTLPTFFSTSLLEDTAFRFTHQIIWKIIIPHKNRDKFKYTNLYHKDINLDKVNLEDSEVEFLLNIGTVLKCIDIQYNYQKTFSIPMFESDPVYCSKTVTLYVYEFQYHKKIDIDKFLKNTY